MTDLETEASRHHLFISGAFHSAPEHHLPAGGTLYLLSPKEPGFWAHLTATAEFLDGAPDPIDRWSARVIPQIATAAGGIPYLPFGGPPWHPFLSWAKASHRASPSPVTLMVHDAMGLWASWRGAIWVDRVDALPEAPPAPCITCSAPCAESCPVAALTAAGYDTAACHAYLDQPDGKDCLLNGCKARAACPVSRTYGRLAEQSEWHMRHFHR
jgi:hypothetical protein